MTTVTTGQAGLSPRLCYTGVVEQSSKPPEGQPGPRLAWVQRAYERQRCGEALAARIQRISEERRAYCIGLIEMMQEARGRGLEVVLDSGCGTGESTRSRVQPGRWILGVDKSLARMDRGAQQGLEVPIWRKTTPPKRGGMDLALRAGGLLARAELSELVALMHHEGCIVDRFDFLYPNPWPKSQHFGRRWYGHPIWPYALAVARKVELRTNWEVYAQEFAAALALWIAQEEGQGQCEEWRVSPGEGLTAFERKYAQAGHALYRVCAQGGATAQGPGAVELLPGRATEAEPDDEEG